MAMDLSFLVTDRNYYEPWDTADPGQRFQVHSMPSEWRRRDSGPWTHWAPTGSVLPDQGWKVHVSSSLDNAQSVLAVVSAVCAELRVPFKHLAGRRMFLLMHDKHAARVQAGKFCTLYPADQQAALAAMQRLEADLAGVSGPFVLTDRRFGSSECVSYRYGAFRTRTRVDAEGAEVATMTGPDGQETEDPRLPEFRLPAGVPDPFRQETTTTSPGGPVTLHGYAFESVIQHSNAGGAYRFRSPEGEQLFVKEARAHNGYTPDGADAKSRLTAEYLALRAISSQEPGLCPRPVEMFHHWEHSYLVMEMVPGDSLYRWMVSHSSLLDTQTTEQAVAEYYRRALALLDQLDSQLRRLHELGFVFVDLSPNNVLVDADDQVRLIDFEAVQPIDDVRRIMGTPGYLHPEPRAVADRDPRELDRYGLAALALLLLFPLQDAAERHPAVLEHLRADLVEIAPLPPRLWQWATTYYRPTESSVLPTPEAVRRNPVAALRWLADRTADWLEAVARPDHPARVYPTNPLGYNTDTRALAAGTAGVLYALHRAGRGCDPAVVRRLRTEALAAAGTSAPGLLYGSAGIAGVLAELGEVDAAETLLTAAAAHPLNRTSATLGGGAAGTAFGLLAHHRRTGEQRWLDLAGQLLDGLPEPDELNAQLSSTKRSGLVGGRTGVALVLYQMYRCTGERALFSRGLRLLEEELAYAEPLPVDGLGFRAAPKDRRVYPYLFAGSAGYAVVLSRYLAHRPDAEFAGGAVAAEVLEQCLRACAVRFAALAGLFPGLAGLAVALADVGDRLNRPELGEAALVNARGLFRYAIPRPEGVGWLGEPGQRLSADLWSGAAGVLLALSRLTNAGHGPAQLIVPTDLVSSLPEERRDHHGRSPAFAD
ncbi:class III lanthionine synthetase LanKC [Jatrophihabitans sp.]|uniref:class III lanthionine synthetase LanKC n=1 Tax=Jatrophihabitans sp. TaxID=1932789 RepID=UPI002CCFF400|nr:class III lanthionine synthetase LanKC [Jatrophihabitans sp.]